MARPRTTTEPLDLKMMLYRPRTRLELNATAYAIELAEAEGVICRAGKQVNAVIWRLTPKGRRRANKKG